MSDASGAVAREIVEPEACISEGIRRVLEAGAPGLSLDMRRALAARMLLYVRPALDQAFAAGEAKGLRDGQASMRAEEAALFAAARDVCRFDWSDSDDPATAAIDHLCNVVAARLMAGSALPLQGEGEGLGTASEERR